MKLSIAIILTIFYYLFLFVFDRKKQKGVIQNQNLVEQTNIETKKTSLIGEQIALPEPNNEKQEISASHLDVQTDDSETSDSSVTDLVSNQNADSDNKTMVGQQKDAAQFFDSPKDQKKEELPQENGEQSREEISEKIQVSEKEELPEQNVPSQEDEKENSVITEDVLDSGKEDITTQLTENEEEVIEKSAEDTPVEVGSIQEKLKRANDALLEKDMESLALQYETQTFEFGKAELLNRLETKYDPTDVVGEKELIALLETDTS